MEVSILCGVAAVEIVDENSTPVVSFNNVPVIGESAGCGNSSRRDFGTAFKANPGLDFYKVN
jgi:hypothetical protein